jgi:hypothetical protein
LSLLEEKMEQAYADLQRAVPYLDDTSSYYTTQSFQEEDGDTSITLKGEEEEEKEDGSAHLSKLSQDAMSNVTLYFHKEDMTTYPEFIHIPAAGFLVEKEDANVETTGKISSARGKAIQNSRQLMATSSGGGLDGRTFNKQEQLQQNTVQIAKDSSSIGSDINALQPSVRSKSPLEETSMEYGTQEQVVATETTANDESSNDIIHSKAIQISRDLCITATQPSQDDLSEHALYRQEDREKANAVGCTDDQVGIHSL